MSIELRTEKDDLHFIPVVDCPCGLKNVPLTAFTPSDGNSYYVLWFCPNCSYVPISDNEIKGYCSIDEISEYDIDYEGELLC